MKKLLLSLTAVLLSFGGLMAAETVTLKLADATDIQGTKEDGNSYYQPTNSFKVNDWSFSFTWKETSSNTVRFDQSGTLRF